MSIVLIAGVLVLGSIFYMIYAVRLQTERFRLYRAKHKWWKVTGWTAYGHGPEFCWDMHCPHCWHKINQMIRQCDRDEAQNDEIIKRFGEARSRKANHG